MKVLFIDTHSEKVTMIIKNDGHIFKNELVSDKSHSEVVIPTLEKLLKESCIKLDELDEIIVVNGPGSFTGVRIGVTISKTLAYSLNIPIKTITSLEMYGVSANEEFDIVTVSDSKGMYSAKYNNGKFDNFNYQKKSVFEEMVENDNLKVLGSKNIDIEKVINYLKDKEVVNPHVVNPIYIKEIDALK